MAFNKRAWGTAGGGTNQTQTVGAGTTTGTQPLQSKWDGKKNIYPEHGQYTEDGKLLIRLNGFLATLRDAKTGNVLQNRTTKQPCLGDDITLNKMAPDVFSIVRKKDLDYIEIQPGKLDAFKQLLPNVLNFLAGTNHYKDTSLNAFADKLDDVLERTPTKDEIDANTKVVVKNWRELLDKLKDPETRKKFLMFQTTYTCHNLLSGYAILSPGNISEVLMKDPKASFVTDAPTWFNKFDRTIIKGHEGDFILITKPDAKFPATKDLDTFLASAGYPQGYWALANNPDTASIAYAAVKQVTKDKNLARGFYSTKVYDVRFTKPRDPNNDKFVKLANLINNLTGELNDAAKAQITAKAQAEGKPVPDFDAKKVGIEDNEGLLKYKKILLAKCKAEGIKIAEVGSTQDIIANAIYAYAEKSAEKLNVLKPENKAYFASAILYSIAMMYGINTPKVANCANTFSKLGDDEKEEVIQKAFPILRSLRFGLDERLGDDITFQEFHDMLMALKPTKETIKKQFDEINERLNKVEF